LLVRILNHADVSALKFQPVLTCILKAAKANTSVFHMVRKPAIKKKEEEEKMKKMMKWSGVFTAAVLLFAFAGEAGAFCVHNKSSLKIGVDQSSGGSFWTPFSVDLDPGKDRCCHWSNTDCNKSGEKFHEVKFNVKVGYNYVCSDVAIPACSDMDITGTESWNIKCVAYGRETCN
jgi:hypothetical protein